MAVKIGLVGMPNAGKSTLFNLLTKLSVPAENYPFNTINPNVGVVEVRIPEVLEIVKLIEPDSLVHAQAEFYDIAGLVKGAAKGEGLGNQFLAHIKEVDVIALVVRKFSASNVEHTLGSIDPKRDIEILFTELQLKDLETIEKRSVSLVRFIEREKETREHYGLLIELKNYLEQGKNAYEFLNGLTDEKQAPIKELFLLTAKPVIYVLNSSEDTPVDEARQSLGLSETDQVVVLDVKMEQEIASMAEDEQKSMMEDFGLDELHIDDLIDKGFRALGHIVFITAGKQEVRSWPIKMGSTAVEAAGKIHEDFTKKFIAAEVVSAKDFIELGGWDKCKAAGKVRLESKTYIVKDKDVIYFRIGA